jgi:predicted dehydrogenase
MLPALQASRNGTLVAIASRDEPRAQQLAARHGIPHVCGDYASVIARDDVEAVYIPLVNSSHRHWTLRALRAGKHVLCEKPLAMSGAEAAEMAASARTAGLCLMEAFMYRFHPRMRALAERTAGVRHSHAAFAFPLESPGNYRLDAKLGGGALLDVGCYTLDVTRWLHGGEPDEVAAVAAFDGGVDTSLAVALRFKNATATCWASFRSPEHQELVVVTGTGSEQLEQPFTAWRDPDDPYLLMVEGFADSVLRGAEVPHPPSESVATARLIDRVRAAMRAGSQQTGAPTG